MVYIWRSVRLHPLPIKLNALCTGDPYLGMFKMLHCALSYFGELLQPVENEKPFRQFQKQFLVNYKLLGVNIDKCCC